MSLLMDDWFGICGIGTKFYSMANITTERYDPARIERIRHFLESYSEKGKPRFMKSL